MKRLILVRHAKSSWINPDQRDIDRPLNKRGVRSAGLIGRWLKKKGHLPQQAVVSSAQRTRETWNGISAEIGEVPAEYSAELYHCTAENILEHLRKQKADAVLLLAHQPGIGDFAQRALPEHPKDGEFHRYPTGATSIIDFDVTDWSGIDWEGGVLIDFIYPRALDKSR